jgi:anaerobic nitric oxide reductase flavorubredoxin
MITELKKGVYWVGISDWELRRFHGHELSTHRGSTYNSYLILDEKTVLIDTVWGPFGERLLENIREIIDPAKIDIIVANHSETDHSGSLPELISHAPHAEIVVSKRGAESVEGHYHRSWKFRPVKTGDRISIGRNELVFVEAPMVHWPDSMFTYLTGHNILMPNDAFGQHYCTDLRFNDQVDREELYEEAYKYYVNILTPYSDIISKKIDEVLSLGLPVDMIAPSHGVIWRDNPMQIVDKYREWTQQKSNDRVVILFNTMSRAPRRMAEAIGDGLADSGVQYKIVNVSVTDRNDALVDVSRSKCIIIGSPTLNNRVLPTIAPILEDLRGLKFKNKIGAAFGSYGWSGESVRIIEEHLGLCSIPLARPGIKCKWQPSAEDLISCRAFGTEIGEITKKVVSSLNR